MEFTFQITQVNREFLIRAPYAALYGNLTIVIDESIIFNEEGISLLDLALSIIYWLNRLDADTPSDFDYSSDEYTDNPVLHLTKIDNRYYTLSSALIEYRVDNIISLDEIVRCFNIFLNALNATIQQDYGVSFADIPLLNDIPPPNPVKKQNKSSL